MGDSFFIVSFVVFIFGLLALLVEYIIPVVKGKK